MAVRGELNNYMSPIMKNDRFELLRSSDNAELWLWEKDAPDGSTTFTMWRSKIFIEVGGYRKQTPDDPIFQTREEGDSWFEKNK